MKGQAGDHPLDERSWTIVQTSNEGISPSLEGQLLTVDGEFLIVSVNYILGSQGTLTTLMPSPKAAYELIPSDPDPTKNIGVYEELREGIIGLWIPMVIINSCVRLIYRFTLARMAKTVKANKKAPNIFINGSINFPYKVRSILFCNPGIVERTE